MLKTLLSFKGFDQRNSFGKFLEVILLYHTKCILKSGRTSDLVAQAFMKVRWAIVIPNEGITSISRKKAEDVFYDPKIAT
jgi:hypothetical protein